MNVPTDEREQEAIPKSIKWIKSINGLITIAVLLFIIWIFKENINAYILNISYEIIIWAFRISINDWITWVICGLICFLLLWGHIKPNFRRIAPSLMTSLGIFGTFVGILLALLPFDPSPDKIGASIDALLSGMSTAFISSCFGLGASIVSRFLWVSSDYKHQQIGRGEQGIINHLATMSHQIHAMSTEIHELRRENREQLEKLMEVINRVLTDNLKALIDEIREVIANQLGETLNKLIKDINEALIDQFGKTIPEFKEAVELLNVWQKENKQHIEELTIAFNNASGGIKSVENSCEKISETMERVDVIIIDTKNHIDELNEILSTFTTMKDEAEKAFPTISKNLEGIGKRLAESAEGLNGSKEKIEQSHKELSKQIEGVIEKAAQDWGMHLVAVAKKCQETIEAVEKQNQIRKE